MKKMKKALTLTLAAIMATTALTACGGNSTSGDSSTAKTDDSASSTGKKVKLTAIMLKHPLTQELAKMDWLTKVEDETGVDIEWQEITADWDQKKGTLLASGDIPDLIVGAGSVLDSDFSLYNGLFEDLTPLIDKYGTNIKTMFTEKPETKTLCTQLDGKIYGLPQYKRYWPAAVSRQYINQKWLDNLGLKVPTTWDELYNVLLAFKNEDANGNGDKNDEIPFDFSPTNVSGFGYFYPTLLLCSTGITLSDASGDGFFVEDGKVKNYFIDERYKDVVKFMNKCSTAGLLNPEVFTQDYTKFQSVARGEGDTAKVGYTYGWEATDRVGNKLAPQYTSMPPLKQTANQTEAVSWDYAYYGQNYNTNMVQMAASCKNKDAAMKFIDKLYDPEVSLQVLFGSEGTNISKDGDNTYTILPPTDSTMDPGTWKWTSSWADDGPLYISDKLNVTLGIDMMANVEQTKPLMDTINAIDKDKDVYPRAFIKYSADDNNTMALNNTALKNLAISKWSTWISEGGVDKEWDQYVKDVEATGLKQTTEIMQKYYDDYMSKNK